jgi:hypothetical protein
MVGSDTDSKGGIAMRIYTGRSRLMEPAMIDVLRRSMAEGDKDHIVVVPKQLTLQTERTLLSALALKGSFRLQVLSPERLCGRIFEAAGQPEGARVDERGRVMLVLAAVHSVNERLKLYHGAAGRRGFAERCARQLELIRQAGLSPERLFACAEQAEAGKPLEVSAEARRAISFVDGRGFMTGFMKGPLPQNYESTHEDAEGGCVVAQVLSYDEATNSCRVNVKNRFSLDDSLELMTPAGQFSCEVLSMKDFRGGDTDTLHPGTEGWIFLSEAVSDMQKNANFFFFLKKKP